MHEPHSGLDIACAVIGQAGEDWLEGSPYVEVAINIVVNVLSRKAPVKLVFGAGP